MISRRSILTQLGVVALVGGAAWWARDHVFLPAPKPRFDDPAGGGWLPMVGGPVGPVVIPVGLGGRLVHALVDSGAQYTAVDAAFARRAALREAAGPPVMAVGVGGGARVAPRVELDLALGGARIPRLIAASLDLESLSRALGAATPLIIGFDVLSAVVTEIDFPRRRLRFLPRGRAEDGLAEGLAAPVRRQGRGLLAEVAIEGRPLEVLVDTGASGHLSLGTAAAESLGLLTRAGRPAQNLVLGGMSMSRVVEVAHLAFAGQDFHDVAVHVIAMPTAPGFPKGLLGVEALRRFRVVMDAGAGRMRLVG